MSMIACVSSKPWVLIRIGFSLFVSGMLGCAYAQTALVELPEDPPANHLFRASERHRFFDSPQADQLSRELVALEREIGFAVYLVTVQSPEKSVLDHLRQQIKLKWSSHRDCLVIFYDFDTRLLALQYEPVFFDRNGMIENSRYSVTQQQTWVGFVDRWLRERQQMNGLDVDLMSLLVLDLTGLLRSQCKEIEPRQTYFWGFVSCFIGLALLVFVAVDRLSRRQKRRVCYIFPTTSMSYRLKARYGGGWIAAHDFGAKADHRERSGMS